MLENAGNNSALLQQLLLNIQKILQGIDTGLDDISSKTGNIVNADERLIKLKDDYNLKLKNHRDNLEEINRLLAETEKTERNIGWVRELERQKASTVSAINNMEGSRNYQQDISSGVNFLTDAVGKLTNGIEKWLNFQTRMANMQTDAIKLGWENISAGQTPYLTKTLGVMTEYTKASLENQTSSNNALISTVGTVVGGVVGGIIGFTAGGVGAAPGAMIGAGIVNQVLDGITKMLEKDQKQKLLDVQKDTSLFGGFKELQLELRNVRLGIGTYLSNKGMSFNNYLMGEGLEKVSETEDAMRKVSMEYAGIPGFDLGEQNKLMMMMSMTKQFNSQSLGGDVNLGKNVNIMSQMTGLGKEEILGYMTEMRIRLDTPLDQLSGKFLQLVDVSDKLNMPLKEVVTNIVELNKANSKYRFSQDEIIGLYSVFSDELKKGTMSIGDLQRFIKGLSDTPMDKAIGIGALINSVDRNSVLSNMKGGDKGIANEFLDAISASGGDAGMLLKLVSQPDASKSPIMQGFMDSQGISQNQLKKWQTQLPKVLMGVASGLTQGSGTDSYAIQQYLFEQFAGMVGQDMPTDFYGQGTTLKGIEKLGYTGNFGSESTGMDFNNTSKRLRDVHDKMVESQISKMQELIPVVNRYNKALEEGKDSFEAYKIVIDDVRKITSGLEKDAKNDLIRAGILQGGPVKVENNHLTVTINENKHVSAEDMKTIEALKKIAQRYKK